MSLSVRLLDNRHWTHFDMVQSQLTFTELRASVPLRRRTEIMREKSNIASVKLTFGTLQAGNSVPATSQYVCKHSKWNLWPHARC